MSYVKENDKFFISDNIWLTHSKASLEGASYPEHYHDFVEFVYMLKGNCTHVIDNKEYPVKRGDMVIINYNQSHSFVGNTDIEYINILMKPEYVNDALINQENAFALLNLSEFESFRAIVDKERKSITFSPEERQRIEQILLHMEKELKENATGWRLAVQSLLNILIIMLFRQMAFDLEGTFDGLSEAALSYIDRHSSEKITLNEMAKRCSYNKSYFSRLFKYYTGVTFTEYLNKIRIEKAVALLETTDMKVEDIYAAVGFGDKTRFFRCFKEITGITPHQCKKSKK